MKSIGIIGCGAVIEILYIRTIRGLFHDFRAYTFDLNHERAEHIAKMINGTPTATAEALINNCNYIIITTPPHTHYEIIKKCLQPGKIIICEKPFVVSGAEAEELVALAAANKAKLYIAHLRRCFPQIALARKVSASGTLGSLTAIRAFEGGRFGYETRSGYVLNNKLGGVLPDTGSHTLDSALFAAGLDKSKLDISIGSVTRNKPEPSHELRSEFTITHGSNKPIVGSLFLSRFRALSNKVVLEFDHGSIEFPTALSDRIKLNGINGSTILRAPHSYSDPLEIFQLQYKLILEDKGDIFAAGNFINLSCLLEKILNN